jgi:Ca-activated chloride channel family protein
VIFEYVIDPIAVKSEVTTIMDGKLDVSISSRPVPVPSFRMRLQHRVSDKPEETDSPPVEVVQALSRLMLYRMQDRARTEIEKGNLEAGTRQLKTLAANLLTQGERSLAQTIMLEVEHIQQKEGLSEEGSKRIKYGTRALFLAPPKKKELIS